MKATRVLSFERSDNSGPLSRPMILRTDNSSGVKSVGGVETAPLRAPLRVFIKTSFPKVWYAADDIASVLITPNSLT
jgi:hypothetical protein